MTMLTIPCTIMRGGTSKGVYFKLEDLPADPEARDRVLLRAMGSPDARQIDGLGGADPLTSKIVIMGRDAPDGCDATYTFGQVGIEEAYVRMTANCGNLSAAAAVYVIEEGWVPVSGGPTTRVRLYNSNTDRVLVMDVPTDADGFVEQGDFTIAGVPGTGSEILLDFAATAGGNTGALMPLGAPRITIDVPLLGSSIDVSVFDVGKPTLFFRAEEIGLKGTEGPDDLSDADFARFWAIRDVAADMLGFGPEVGHLPTPVAVAPPTTYSAYGTGEVIDAAQMDFCARRVIGPPPRMHKAFAGTGATCTAVAAVTHGSVVHELRGTWPREQDLVRLGHPTGVMPLRARYGEQGDLEVAAFSRTARRILDGIVRVPL